ncbi:helix-hairpin-helix domain-containing protein [Rummeliibacillus sp. NPDC094406]|uniref:helix-hairpin-helix domain-containing protein n=1 Tax=Rummeliibacillus sp. NPDC094406 TaxID=3364511 RepID=UPI0037FE9772
MCELIPSFLKKNGKKYGIPIVILLCIIVFYISNQSSTPPQDELFSTIEKEKQLNMEEPETKTESEQKGIKEQGVVATTSIMVDVKGAVKNPGVYKLDADSRVIDAILLAGGYAKNAQSRQINHAQKLQDEMVIYVPQKGEKVEEVLAVSSAETTTSVPSTQDGTMNTAKSDLVNINTADESGLTTLNGIGPAKAKAIIAYRTENGPFKTIEDLKNVTGIGEKTFESLKDYLTIQ